LKINLKTKKKIINFDKTSINSLSSDSIKKLNNTRISEDEENEISSRIKKLDDKYFIYISNENNLKPKIQNNFIQENNNKYINIVKEIKTNNVNLFSHANPIRKDSNEIYSKIPLKKESRKISYISSIQIGDKKQKTPKIPINKDENLKNIISKTNFIVSASLKNINFNSSKNSSINIKSPLFSQEGMAKFVNKAKLTVGVKNKSEKNLTNAKDDNNNYYFPENSKVLYNSIKSNNYSFTEFNSNDKNLDDENWEQLENNRYLGNSSKPYNCGKINLKENEILHSSFNLAESSNFPKANYKTNFNNSCKDTEKLSFGNINKNFEKNSLPNSNNILNHLAKKEELYFRKSCLSKVTLNKEKLNSSFAYDIDYIIANKKNKNSLINKDNNFLDAEAFKDIKKSSLINNKETYFHTCSQNSEGINSGKITATEKADELVLFCTSQKIQFLKTNLGNFFDDNSKNNLKNLNENFIIENISIDFISKYYLEENKIKIIKIQKFFRGFLLRKIFKRCFGNYENLLLMMNLYDKLSNAKEFQIKKSLFKNLTKINDEIKLQICKKFYQKIDKINKNKLKKFKDYSLRKFYLYSFTIKISTDLEIKQILEVNEIIEKQKNSYLLLQKEKENNTRDLKLLFFITNIINTKLFQIKSLFIKQLKTINTEVKILEEKKIYLLKKIISFTEKKSFLKYSNEYLSYYQKGLFIYWKNISQKLGFINKMKMYMLENIISKKIKIKNDENIFLFIIEKRNRGEKVIFDKNNIYCNLIKDSYVKIFIHFNKIYMAQIDSENKSNKLMFILHKLIYTKKNEEMKILKKFLINLRAIAKLKKNEIMNKRRIILSKLIKLFSIRISNLIKSKFNKWQNEGNKISKRNKKLLNLLMVKICKNYNTTRTHFKNFRYKAKKISIQFKKLNSLFDVIKYFENKVISQIFQQLIKKLRRSAKWNSESEDMKTVSINCNMTRETLEKTLNILDNDIELFNDTSINEFSIEKNLRFKKMNCLWKLSNKNKLILRYYFLKFLNRTNLILVKEIKRNSFEWSSDTFYKGTNRNSKENQFIEKEKIKNNYSKEQTMNDSFTYMKARNILETTENNDLRIEGNLIKRLN
jgi:hypothetical protein